MSEWIDMNERLPDATSAWLGYVFGSDDESPLYYQKFLVFMQGGYGTYTRMRRFIVPLREGNMAWKAEHSDFWYSTGKHYLNYEKINELWDWDLGWWENEPKDPADRERADALITHWMPLPPSPVEKAEG